MAGFSTTWNDSTPRERTCVGWAFGWFFCLLSSYFVLRPLRETFAVDAGTGELPWLFAATFAVILIASPLFAGLSARLARGTLVKVVYRGFALHLILFLMAAKWLGDDAQIWVARLFFIWTSVFALFNTSVFWSVLTDVFSNRQAKRLFGLIAAGGTLGGICGSLLTASYAKQLGTAYLLLLPIVFLEVGVQFAGQLQRAADALNGGPAKRSLTPPTGGPFFAGLEHVLRSPYLLGVCGFLMLGQLCATQLYMTQTIVVEAAVAKADRPALFAGVNLTIQVLTLAIQSLLFSRLARWAGVPFILLLVPMVYCSGFAALAFVPALQTLLVVVVLCSALTYGMIVPSREVLFTVVSREDKYKSKNFIDTAVMRGGDTISAQALRVVGPALLTLPFILGVMCPLALVWGGVGWLLGRRQQKMASSVSVQPDGPVEHESKGASDAVPL